LGKIEDLMTADFATLEHPVMQGAGCISTRRLDPHAKIITPGEVISADDHWEITEDIFYENFPAHLKERAPRVWFEGYWHIGRPGVKEAFGIGPNIERTLRSALLHAGWSHDVRRAHLKAEGIAKEIVFPQSFLGYIDPDLELRELMFRIYNEYIAEQHRVNPDFFGVGLFSNWWDSPKIEKAMEQLIALGLKAFVMPHNLKGEDGRPMSYADPKMERFWSVVNEARLPVAMHIGEAVNFDGRGEMATGTLVNFAPFRKPISQLIFGGVFDRHPNVEVVFAEGGLGWVLAWLQDAELVFETYDTLLDPISHRPSHYWRHNCYATFQADALGLAHLDVLGADRVMWAADYPHTEGTFSVSQKMMQSVIEQAGPQNGRLILGDNAKRVFRV
jgi:predicted TIM-barrel fold metal-dependent hydrolase